MRGYMAGWLAGCVQGAAGFLLIKALLLGVYIVAALVCAACLGLFSTWQYLDIHDK